MPNKAVRYLESKEQSRSVTIPVPLKLNLLKKDCNKLQKQLAQAQSIDQRPMFFELLEEVYQGSFLVSPSQVMQKAESTSVLVQF